MSKRIINERAKGQFKDWGDFIARVKGVGEKNAANFRQRHDGQRRGLRGCAAKPAKDAKAKKEKTGRSAGRCWRHARRCRHPGRDPRHRHQTRSRRPCPQRPPRRPNLRRSPSSSKFDPAWSTTASASGSKKARSHAPLFALFLIAACACLVLRWRPGHQHTFRRRQSCRRLGVNLKMSPAHPRCRCAASPPPPLARTTWLMPTAPCRRRPCRKRHAGGRCAEDAGGHGPPGKRRRRTPPWPPFHWPLPPGGRCGIS